MQAGTRRTLLALAVLVPACVWGVHSGALAQGRPQVDAPYQRFFVHYVDQRSFLEKALNAIGLTQQEVGRSFALVAGVAQYPNLPPTERTLAPAAEDVRKLTDYLRSQEFFDEIVVLKDDDVSIENFNFFLHQYFPSRLRAFPKSRFLLAYSGHGMTEGANGYLLTKAARSLSDRETSIAMTVLRSMTEEVVESGHHVLVLLNACFGGTFLRRSFGSGTVFSPRNPGAHAITAGGTRELTWHVSSVGPGSIFFEKLFAGLDGRADVLPRNGDGIVTVDELAAYLKQEVQISTDQTQNPQVGDLSRDGSLGGFFFLNRRRMVDRGLAREWKPGDGLRFGEGERRLQNTWIAFVAPFEGRGAIFLMRPDGTEIRRVTDSWESHVAWSPDGTRIAFASEDADGVGIFVRNRDGGNAQRIVPPDWTGNAPAWSLDGTRVAFSRNIGGVALVNADGTELQMITDTGSEPSWSADGNRLAISGAVDPSGTRQVFQLDLYGRPPKPLYSGGGRLTSEGSSWRPRWSPDGTKIAFEGSRGDGSGTQIYVMDANGANQRRVTNLPGPWSPCCASWSPDSSKIAVATPEAIFVVSMDGSEPVRVIGLGWSSVSPNAFDVGFGPSWSPFPPK